MNTQTDGDRQIEDLLKQIQKAENDIIDLEDLKKRAGKTKLYKEKKAVLWDGLEGDVEELRKKISNLRTEIDSMLSNSNNFESDKTTREQRISDQKTKIRELEIQIRDLKQKLKELEHLSIEGFTDAEILDLREILDSINKKIGTHFPLSNL